MATTAEAVTSAPPTPFELVGGRETVAKMVNAFYDLMAEDPAYAELRKMHAPDLGPMKTSLTGYMTAWLGGPRDWFEENPGKCMMSLHSPLGVSKQTAQQWISAMSRAIEIAEIDSALATAMAQALAQMASGMIRSD